MRKKYIRLQGEGAMRKKEKTDVPNVLEELGKVRQLAMIVKHGGEQR